MAEARPANPLVDQFRRGGVPRDLRLMAAQGVLPLKPEDLVDLWELLRHDPDEEVARTAGDALAAFPQDQLLPIVRDRQTAPALLGWALAHRTEPGIREAVLQNVSTADEAIEAVVAALPQDLAELVVINQVRLLRRTSLLEALEANPSLNNDQRRRLRELRETFHVSEAAPVPEAPAPPPPPVPAAEAAAEPEPPLEEAPLSEQEAVVQYLSEDERKQPEKLSTIQRLYKMNTAEKVITAIKGSREERGILVRDRNRLVSAAVLGSPRLTEAEVEGFAAMKNISDEILRKIATNRDWTKNYNIVMNLVKNPRTPVGVALTYIARASARDMKALAVDRNVPEAVRKRAQSFVKAAAEGGQKRH